MHEDLKIVFVKVSTFFNNPCALEIGSVIHIVRYKGSTCKEVIIRRQAQEIKSLT